MGKVAMPHFWVLGWGLLLEVCLGLAFGVYLYSS